MEKQFLGLRTVIYKVPDMTAAKEWYSKAFDTTPYFDEPFYVGFSIAGYELGLQPDPSSGSLSGGVIAYWGVPDVDKAFQKMLDSGATVESEPADVGGEIKVAEVKDPWNNLIGLIYNPHFKAEGGN
ncbi:MAG TPA: VOC family protein [Flavisolibacter sp.]